jgi:hypothetical protein
MSDERTYLTASEPVSTFMGRAARSTSECVSVLAQIVTEQQAEIDRLRHILLRLVDAIADMGGKAAGELRMGEDVLGLRVEVGTKI